MLIRTLIPALLGVALPLSAGCLGLDDEQLGETTQDLNVANWSAAARVGADQQQAYRSGQVAALNGVTYMVHSGACGSTHCGGDSSKDLWWTQLGANGVWANDIKIPNQLAAHKVSLAPFNG